MVASSNILLQKKILHQLLFSSGQISLCFISVSVRSYIIISPALELSFSYQYHYW